MAESGKLSIDQALEKLRRADTVRSNHVTFDEESDGGLFGRSIFLICTERLSSCLNRRWNCLTQIKRSWSGGDYLMVRTS